MKQGQGIGMNTIIIAAIALLVLVIVSVIVIQSGGNLRQAKQCTAIPGAQCIEGDEQCDSGYAEDSTRQCPNKEKCCVPTG